MRFWSLFLLCMLPIAAGAAEPTLAELVAAAAPKGAVRVDNDPAAWNLSRPTVLSIPKISSLSWFRPPADALGGHPLEAANNNVGIAYSKDRLFVGWRNNTGHWPSPDSSLFVVSTPDWGKKWDFEQHLALGADVREPNFFSNGDDLQFQFFVGSAKRLEFKPKSVMRSRRRSLGEWEKAEPFGTPEEVVWDILRSYGAHWITSYRGGHYDFSSNAPKTEVFLRYSFDGKTWRFLTRDGKDSGAEKVVPFRTGRTSEISVGLLPPRSDWRRPDTLPPEAKPYARLVGVGRNEDGEVVEGKAVIGSIIFSANLWRVGDALLLSSYRESRTPYMYDSPRVVVHAGTAYLLARRVVGAADEHGVRKSLPAEWAMPNATQLVLGRVAPLLGSKWAQRMRTALYEIDPDAEDVFHLTDLPSAGDTAFPSVLRLSDDHFLVANYTSSLEHGAEYSWFEGQQRATSIYFTMLHFETAGDADAKLLQRLERIVAAAARAAGMAPDRIASPTARLLLAIKKESGTAAERTHDRQLRTLSEFFEKKGDAPKKHFAAALRLVADQMRDEKKQAAADRVRREEERLAP